MEKTSEVIEDLSVGDIVEINHKTEARRGNLTITVGPVQAISKQVVTVLDRDNHNKPAEIERTSITKLGLRNDLKPQPPVTPFPGKKKPRRFLTD